MVGVGGCFGWEGRVAERELSESRRNVPPLGGVCEPLICKLVRLSEGLFARAGLLSLFALLGDFVSLFPFGFGIRVGVGLVGGEVGGEDMMAEDSSTRRIKSKLREIDS